MQTLKSAARIFFASLEDLYDSMGDEAMLISVENNVADLNGRCFNRLNRDHIFVQYGRMHAVAGSAEFYSVTIGQKIRNQLWKYLCIINSVSVKSVGLEERFT